MKLATKNLTGAALDFAVAKIKGSKFGEVVFNPCTQRVYETEGLRQIGVHWAPSKDWNQGGPIIERERIKVSPNVGGTWSAQIRHEDSHPSVATKVVVGWTNTNGPTPLIAAMRCYCCAKIGEEIEVPEELCG